MASMEWLGMSYKEYLAMAVASLVFLVLTTNMAASSLPGLAGKFVGIFLLVFGIVAVSKWLVEAMGLEDESEEKSA